MGNAKTTTQNPVQTVALGVHPCTQGRIFTPTESTNGTLLPGRPNVTRGIRFKVPSGDSITYCRRRVDDAPTGAPDAAEKVTELADAEISLAVGESLYVTAVVGTGVRAMWIA